VLAKLQQWILAQRVLRRSSFGKALSYIGKRWIGLTRFVEDGRIPLDNNATERAIRGPVIGRKNHYGSRSQAGTEVAAIFYSLVESATLAGVNPAAYLREATRRALADPKAVLLPHELVVEVQQPDETT
jgi:transposase